MNLSEEIEKLSKLKADGLMSDEEFAHAKAKLIDGAGVPATSGTSSTPAVDVNQWSMFIHLAQFAGYVVPLAGFILPIVLWQIKKDESPVIDQHGKNVTNWLISALIYGAICAVLAIIVIGILGLIALAVAGVIFGIVGALKANEGIVWKYPLTIQFFK